MNRFLTLLAAMTLYPITLAAGSPPPEACRPPPIVDLTRYDLGRDSALDQHIMNINRVSNEAMKLLGATQHESNRALLDELKRCYSSRSDEFDPHRDALVTSGYEDTAFPRFVATAGAQFADVELERIRQLVSQISSFDDAARPFSGSHFSDPNISAADQFIKLRADYFETEPLPFRRSFIEFALEARDSISYRSEHVRASQLGLDPELDALVARYAKAWNDFSPCSHPPTTMSIAEALPFLKGSWYVGVGVWQWSGVPREKEGFVAYVRWQVEEVMTVLAPCPPKRRSGPRREFGALPGEPTREKVKS